MPDAAVERAAQSAPDIEKFRLRRFVERLSAIGEVERHDEPTALTDLSRIIEASPKATLFTQAGPERFEIATAVCGGRRRMAEAFGVAPQEIAHEYMRRLAKPQPIIEVASSAAPVHQVVQAGEVRAALGGRPLHFQELLQAVGSNDGREVTLALDALRQAGELSREPNGEWTLHR